jgi:hypothetical protein
MDVQIDPRRHQRVQAGEVGQQVSGFLPAYSRVLPRTDQVRAAYYG